MAAVLPPLIAAGGFGLYFLTSFRLARYRRVPWEFLAVVAAGAALGGYRLPPPPRAAARAGARGRPPPPPPPRAGVLSLSLFAPRPRQRARRPRPPPPPARRGGRDPLGLSARHLPRAPPRPRGPAGDRRAPMGAPLTRRADLVRDQLAPPPYGTRRPPGAAPVRLGVSGSGAELLVL